MRIPIFLKKFGSLLLAANAYAQPGKQYVEPRAGACLPLPAGPAH